MNNAQFDMLGMSHTCRYIYYGCGGNMCIHVSKLACNDMLSIVTQNQFNYFKLKLRQHDASIHVHAFMDVCVCATLCKCVHV